MLAYDKFDLRKASTFIGAVAGSVVVLLIWRLFDRAQPAPMAVLNRTPAVPYADRVHRRG